MKTKKPYTLHHSLFFILHSLKLNIISIPFGPRSTRAVTFLIICTLSPNLCKNAKKYLHLSILQSGVYKMICKVLKFSGK